MMGYLQRKTAEMQAVAYLIFFLVFILDGSFLFFWLSFLMCLPLKAAIDFNLNTH